MCSNGVASQGICWKEGVHVFLWSHAGKEASCSWAIEGPWGLSICWEVSGCCINKAICKGVVDGPISPVWRWSWSNRMWAIFTDCKVPDRWHGLSVIFEDSSMPNSADFYCEQSSVGKYSDYKADLLAHKKSHLHFQSAKSLKHRMTFNPWDLPSILTLLQGEGVGMQE